MSAAITFDPILVETGSVDSEGRLAYRDGRLVGVLTLLDAELHGELGVGLHWFLEAGFGRAADDPRPPTFPTLDAARLWLDVRTAPVTPRCAANKPEITPHYAADIVSITPRCAAAGHSPSADGCGTGPAPRR